uniref:hypothetical protein n=1 Tax=Verrucomicrobium sp. BvORR034 TaxID=1396418 RepID=UPI002240EF47
WGTALALLITFLPLCCLGPTATFWAPDVAGFFKSFLLGASGLALAWMQHRTHTGNIRRYAAMQGLFRGADFRLTQKLAALRHSLTQPATPPSPAMPTATDLVRQIQDLLLSVGQEALAENAEWIVMRRTRRIQPVPPSL